MLLRAYPGGYRRERGEEIIATLLEATPEGRRRPLARDMRALIMGGLRARAAQHRGVTTAVNLRLAVLAGVCIYLGTAAAADLASFAAGDPGREWLALALPAGWPVLLADGWPVLLAGLLMAAAVAVAWLARRLFVTGASLAAAAAASYLFVYVERDSFLVTEVVCLAAVVALAGGTGHRSPAWLWLIGTVVAALALPGFLPVITIAYISWWEIIALGMYLAVIVAAVAWVAIDARPLVAMAAYTLLWLVPPRLGNLAGIGNLFHSPALPAAAAIAALALWRLRRQSQRQARRRSSGQ
jgi:hypothetical protein